MIKRKQPILSQNLLFIKDRLQYKANGFYYLFSLCDHHFIFTRWISVGGRQLAINGHAVCNTHSLLLLIMIPSSSTLKMVIELDAFCTCFYLHRIGKFIKKENLSNTFMIFLTVIWRIVYSLFGKYISNIWVETCANVPNSNDFEDMHFQMSQLALKFKDIYGCHA